MNKLRRSPSVDAAPIVAPNHLHDIKTERSTRPLPRRPGFSTVPTGRDPPPSLHAAREHGRELDQGFGEDVRDDDSPPAEDSAGTPCISSCAATSLRTAFSRVAMSACGSRSTAITWDAPSFKAAMPENAGAASVIDHRAARQRQRIEHLQAQRRRRMRAGAERETGIEPHHDGVADHPAAQSRVGHTQSRRPKRIGFQSLSQTRSQSRLSTARKVALA